MLAFTVCVFFLENSAISVVTLAAANRDTSKYVEHRAYLLDLL